MSEKRAQEGKSVPHDPCSFASGSGFNEVKRFAEGSDFGRHFHEGLFDFSAPFAGAGVRCGGFLRYGGGIVEIDGMAALNGPEGIFFVLRRGAVVKAGGAQNL